MDGERRARSQKRLRSPTIPRLYNQNTEEIFFRKTLRKGGRGGKVSISRTIIGEVIIEKLQNRRRNSRGSAAKKVDTVVGGWTKSVRKNQAQRPS